MCEPHELIAVGSTQSGGTSGFTATTLALKWNGADWSIVPSPSPTGADDAQLDAVSCTTATDCFAVGSYAKFSTAPTSFAFVTLVEHWNGTRWSIVASPNPSAFATQLSGVSCSSSTSCFAVGSSISAANGGTLIEHWDGLTWSIVPSPNPSGSGSDPQLSAVLCCSDSSCFAVGDSGGSALVERWDGATWSIVASPAPPGGGEVQLAGVSCATLSDCFAVGDSFNDTTGPSQDNGSGNVIEHWDGAAWSIVAGASDATSSSLAGIACPVSTSCYAVGNSAIAQRWDGLAWSQSALQGKSSQSHLFEVSCARATDCFAVGYYGTASTDKTLIEHWNGTAWSIVPSPNPNGAFETRLIGVSCPSPTSCTAVGSKAALVQEPLIEHWNGTSWSIVAGPDPKGSDAAELLGVSCATATTCDAVGLNLSKIAFAPLTEHWNGKTWSIVPSPSPSHNPKGAILAQLIGVSCPVPTSCTAVGLYSSFSTSPPALSTKPLIERWDGTRWSIAPNPTPQNATFAILSGASCPAPANCNAVGIQSAKAGGVTSPLAVHWNGTSWTVVPTPHLTTQSNLGGLSCRSAFSCYAVGSSSTASATRTLVEHWNGAAWTVVATPNPTSTSNVGLAGISCPSSTSCIAVGSYGANSGSFALTERGT